MKAKTAPLMEAFSTAAAKGTHRSSLNFIDAILAERPDLKDEMVYVPRQGMMGNVVFIGNEVFKGPSSEEAKYYYDVEMGILPQLKGTGLKAPQITCIGKNTVFFGMVRIPGVPLNSVGDLKPEEKQALAEDIADFMLGMAQAVKGSPGKYAWSTDINGGNILVDPETKKMTGIIDFGDIAYGPVESFRSAVGNGINDGDMDTEVNELVEKELAARKANFPGLKSVAAKSSWRSKADALFSS